MNAGPRKKTHLAVGEGQEAEGHSLGNMSKDMGEQSPFYRRPETLTVSRTVCSLGEGVLSDQLHNHPVPSQTEPIIYVF